MTAGGWQGIWPKVVRFRFALFGTLAVVLALCATIAATVIAGQVDEEGSPVAGSSSLALLWVIISATAQIAGAFLFSRENAPNRKVFRNALSRQAHLLGDLSALTDQAEEARKLTNAAEVRTTLGLLSVGLSTMTRDAESVMSEWASLMPDGSDYSTRSEELEAE